MFNELSLAACGAKLFSESIKIINRILQEKKYPQHMEKILEHNLTTIQKIVDDKFNGIITYKSKDSK